MSFVIPRAVEKRSAEASAGRGTSRLDALLVYIRAQLQSGEEVVGFSRDGQGRLVATVAAKPDQSNNPIPEKFRRKTGLS